MQLVVLAGLELLGEKVYLAAQVLQENEDLKGGLAELGLQVTKHDIQMYIGTKAPMNHETPPPSYSTRSVLLIRAQT